MNNNMSISITCVWRQLQEEVDVLADRMEQANNSLKGDWVRWQHSMKTDLRSAFVSAAEKNVEYYEKVSSPEKLRRSTQRHLSSHLTLVCIEERCALFR